MLKALGKLRVKTMVGCPSFVRCIHIIAWLVWVCVGRYYLAGVTTYWLAGVSRNWLASVSRYCAKILIYVECDYFPIL